MLPCSDLERSHPVLQAVLRFSAACFRSAQPCPTTIATARRLLTLTTSTAVLQRATSGLCSATHMESSMVILSVQSAVTHNLSRVSHQRVSHGRLIASQVAQEETTT